MKRTTPRKDFPQGHVPNTIQLLSRSLRGYLHHIFGILLILFSHLSSTVHAQSPPTYIQFSSWGFHGTNWDSDFSYSPRSFTNLLSVTNSSHGNCLLLDSTNAAWLQYNVIENDGFTNLTVDRGTVIFWFSPSWSGTNAGGSGPGDWGRLFEVGSYTADASYGWWSIYTDPPGTHLYFSAQTNNGSGGMYLSVPITWTNNDWHCIALTYSSTNSTLYLDGVFATNGASMIYWPGQNVLTNGFYVGSASNGMTQAHGMFGDLSTYDSPLDIWTIRSLASMYSIIYEERPFALGSAPSSPSYAPFNAITGTGYLQYLSNAISCVTSSNIWMTNVLATLTTNGTVNLVFTIAGGTSNLLYDVFANGSLAFSGTNSQWAWMGQGPSCATYLLTNLPNGGAFLILGQPTDSDLDGLTDAYENLVSKTNPSNPDTDGDGMLDGWEILWGLNPLLNDSGQTGQRSNYSYDAVGWLESITGIRAETVVLDAEGNVQQNSQ